MLIFHYLRTYLRILSASLETFGFGVWFLNYLIRIPLKIIYIHTSLFLDNIFFPKYRRVKIENPVFIIGHPRSGTTFMHTILTQTKESMIFTDWELHNPSLTLRKLVKHSKKLQGLFSFVFDIRFTPHKFKIMMKDKKKGIRKKDKIVGGASRTERNLEYKALEEETVFVNILDTQFVANVTPLGFVERGFPELCLCDEQPHQSKSVLFLKNCFKRQIYYTGKTQVLAQINYSLFRIKTMLKFFPDAKIIYIARSPLETIPSHLSLLRDRISNNFGLENVSEDKIQQFYKHRYEYNIMFYRYFDVLINGNEIPKNQILEINYNSIKDDLWNVIQQIKNFTKLQFSPQLEEKLIQQSKEQSSRKRKHKNLQFEMFGLTEEKVRSDFDFVFKRYGFQ